MYPNFFAILYSDGLPIESERYNPVQKLLSLPGVSRIINETDLSKGSRGVFAGIHQANQSVFSEMEQHSRSGHSGHGSAAAQHLLHPIETTEKHQLSV
jgi:hypothetical protein